MSREMWVDFQGTYDAVINNPLIVMEFFEQIAPGVLIDFENFTNPLTEQRKKEVAVIAEKVLETLGRMALLPKTEYDTVMGTIKEMTEEKVPIKGGPIGEIAK